MRVIVRSYESSRVNEGDWQGTCLSECNSQDPTTSFSAEACMTFEEWVSATSKGTPLREDETVRCSAQVEDNPYEDSEEEDI